MRAGSCPDKTDLVIATRAGKKPLQVAPGKADITLDQSAKMVIANYDVPDADVHGIFNPTNLTGDQLALSLYLTSKTPLAPTDYLSVGTNKDAPNQLNNIGVWSAQGREVVGGTSKPDQKATIIKVDKDLICGTVDTNEATGTWVAKVL